MFRCKKGSCIYGEGDMCCHECSHTQCEDRCWKNPTNCNSAIGVEQPNELVLFESTAMATMQKIADLDYQKKQLEAKDKEVRKQLLDLMDFYGIKKFENEILQITFIEPTTRTTIDSKRLKEELPAVAEKYSKTTNVKGSVRIDVK